MSRQTTPAQLAKFLHYILEIRPDEFGLVANRDGWFRLKDLLKVFGEEKGWRHVRIQDLNELRLTMPSGPFLMEGDAIRGRCTDRLPVPLPVDAPPKLLYTCVRRRAYPHIIEEGIAPSVHPRVISASDARMADRIGKRIDGKPVLLTIQTAKAQACGLTFERYGESLFLSDPIPATCFTGPPLPREKPAPADAREAAAPVPSLPVTPGSFLIDPANIPGVAGKPNRKGVKKEIRWKRQRERDRRKGRTREEW